MYIHASYVCTYVRMYTAIYVHAYLHRQLIAETVTVWHKSLIGKTLIDGVYMKL